MDFSSQTAIRLRSIGRRLGILPPLVRALRKLSGERYEARFDAALRAAIRPGDTVWDIGANTGLYTARFADWVGPLGRVVAFEPSPRNAAALRTQFANRGNVTIVPVALADRVGSAPFYTNGEADGTTDSLLARGPDTVRHEVRVRRGEEFLAQFPPDAMKIDVEGFEYEVVLGLGAALTEQRLRRILIEVHFEILSDRGRADAPLELAAYLRDAGLSVSWVSASHLSASRPVARPDM